MYDMVNDQLSLRKVFVLLLTGAAAVVSYVFRHGATIALGQKMRFVSGMTVASFVLLIAAILVGAVVLITKQVNR